MNAEQLAKFSRIRKLLAYGYERNWRFDDGMHKSSDGYCAVFYPKAWEDEGCGGIEPSGLEIYSYALGPSRMHYFHKGSGRGDYAEFYSADPFQTALEEVSKWIKEQDERLAEDSGPEQWAQLKSWPYGDL